MKHTILYLIWATVHAWQGLVEDRVVERLAQDLSDVLSSTRLFDMPLVVNGDIDDDAMQQCRNATILLYGKNCAAFNNTGSPMTR